MRYLKSKKVFESLDQTSKMCEEFGISNWSINESGLVDVDGDVYLGSRSLEKIPINFGNVSGNFDCSYNQLTSLEKAPKSVSGNFDCSWNQLTSLEKAPERVEGNFNCTWNQLTSLEGAPKSVSGNFYCRGNQLTSLEGAPESVSGDFWCSDNPQLTSFDWVPKYIGGYLMFNRTPISEIWDLFIDWTELDLFNDCDPIRGDSIDLNRLNYFLETIGEETVQDVPGYKILN